MKGLIFALLIVLPVSAQSTKVGGTAKIAGTSKAGGAVGGGGGGGYEPTNAIDMTASGGLDVFVPGDYTVGNFAHCTAAQGTGCASPTAGIPAVGVTWYQPKFANADSAVEGHAATSVFNSFPAAHMVMAASTASTGCGGGVVESFYSTTTAISEDNSYLAFDDGCGALDIVHFTGASETQRVSGYTFGDIATSNSPSGEVRWMRGVHKDKIVYKSGGTLRVYKVSTDRWCTALSADALSDTCSSTTAATYWTPGVTWNGIGGNEGDVSGNNIIPLTNSASNPVGIHGCDIVAKTCVTMADVPTGTLDHAEPSIDGTLMGATISAAWYTWTRSTGAILNGGAASLTTGHAAFGKLADGTNVRITFTVPGGESCNNGSFGPQKKSIFAWSGTTATDFLQHASPRDPQTTCADSHYSAHTTDTPTHRLAAFDLSSGGDGDPRVVTSGALSANWDNDWRYLANEIVVCDYGNVAADIINAPNCWRVTHHRAYDDNRDCNGCPNISADGNYITFRSHLGTDISSSAKRIYVVRVGPLR